MEWGRSRLARGRHTETGFDRRRVRMRVRTRSASSSARFCTSACPERRAIAAARGCAGPFLVRSGLRPRWPARDPSPKRHGRRRSARRDPGHEATYPSPAGISNDPGGDRTDERSINGTALITIVFVIMSRNRTEPSCSSSQTRSGSTLAGADFAASFSDPDSIWRHLGGLRPLPPSARVRRRASIWRRRGPDLRRAAPGGRHPSSPRRRDTSPPSGRPTP